MSVGLPVCDKIATQTPPPIAFHHFLQNTHEHHTKYAQYAVWYSEKKNSRIQVQESYTSNLHDFIYEADALDFSDYDPPMGLLHTLSHRHVRTLVSVVANDRAPYVPRPTLRHTRPLFRLYLFPLRLIGIEMDKWFIVICHTRIAIYLILSPTRLSQLRPVYD